MDYKYDEENYAKLIIKEGFQSGFIKYELLVMVKYLKKIGKKKKETVEFIYDFCEKHIEGYNKVKYYKVIDGAIRDGRKKNNNLIVVEKIDIMKNEMEYIDNLNIEHEYKKILLTLIVSKKISMEIHKIQSEDNDIKLSFYFDGTRKKYSEIFKQSNIVGNYKINDMINDLVDKEIITSVIKGNIILSYAENIKKGGDIYYSLLTKDFENVGYVFDYYKGVNKVKMCEGENCNRLIKGTSNNIKYCNNCADKIQFNQKKEWDRLKRER